MHICIYKYIYLIQRKIHEKVFSIISCHTSMFIALKAFHKSKSKQKQLNWYMFSSVNDYDINYQNYTHLQ